MIGETAGELGMTAGGAAYSKTESDGVTTFTVTPLAPPLVRRPWNFAVAGIFVAVIARQFLAKGVGGADYVVLAFAVGLLAYVWVRKPVQPVQSLRVFKVSQAGIEADGRTIAKGEIRKVGFPAPPPPATSRRRNRTPVQPSADVVVESGGDPISLGTPLDEATARALVSDVSGLLGFDVAADGRSSMAP